LTDNFKAGDRVRMTKGNDIIETTLIEYAQGVCVELTGNHHNALYLSVYTSNGWSIEKLKGALPTAAGSVVKVDRPYGALLYMLDEDGDWVRYDQAYGTLSFKDSDWELVFDAGKVDA